jgi:hypothetical protein
VLLYIYIEGKRQFFANNFQFLFEVLQKLHSHNNMKKTKDILVNIHIVIIINVYLLELCSICQPFQSSVYICTHYIEHIIT